MPQNRTRTQGPLSPFLFDIILEVLASFESARKKKRHKTWGGVKIRLSLFTDNMIKLTENPKNV